MSGVYSLCWAPHIGLQPVRNWLVSRFHAVPCGNWTDITGPYVRCRTERTAAHAPDCQAMRSHTAQDTYGPANAPVRVPFAMKEETLTVLLVSDVAADAGLIGKALAGSTGNEWRLERVGRLCDGVDRLRKTGIGAVLLDLFLPDSQGIGTFETLFESAPLVPILVLTDRENEAIAMQATRLGAQDHLLKDHLDAYWLPLILRSAIERKAGEEAFFMEKERAQVTLNSIGDAYSALISQAT